MSDALPEGITHADVLRALAALDEGATHTFAPSTQYDLLHNGRRYAPKAVIGLAAERLVGRRLGPYDFRGGVGSRCFRILERLGFAIVAKPSAGHGHDEEPLDKVSSYWEGAVRQTWVNRFERDRSARETCIREHGTRCHVCDFSFGEEYGDLGAGFVHVHHTVPLSSIRATYRVNPVRDLRPVCPNCHAMLHLRVPPFAISELRDIRRLVSTRKAK